MKKRFMIKFIVLFSLLIISIIFNQSAAITSEVHPKTEDNFSNQISLLTTSYPINIYSDADFITLGLPGNGSIDNPYRIEDYLIQDSVGYGIFISSVTQHFVIQNCVIRNSLFDGILIQKANNSTGNVSNNICENNGNAGILILESEGITAENNYCSGNHYGIEVRLSTDSYIFNNTCESNRLSGMYLRQAIQGSIFANNSLINNNYFGMNFFIANGSFVHNNTFENSGVRIYEESLESYLLYDFLGNIVNNQKIGYFKNVESLYLTDTEYGQIFLFNCSNVYIENQNFVRTLFGVYTYESSNCTFHNNIFDSNLGHGIDVFNSDKIIIDSNTFNNNSNGLNFYNSPNMTISNNVFYSDGLVIENADIEILATYIVENNTVNDKPLGFFFNNHSLVLSGAVQYGEILVINSSNIEIHNQAINDTQIGILFAFSNSCSIFSSVLTNMLTSIGVFGCNDITISDNRIEYNIDGIIAVYVSALEINNNIVSYSLDDGMEISYCDNISIDNNICEFNAWGLNLRYSENVNVSSSIFQQNTFLNLFAFYTSDMIIYNTTCAFAEWGIYFAFVNDVYVYESKMLNNNVDGVFMINSLRLELYSNNISYNFFGIKAKISDYCTFTYNTFRENLEYGISLDPRCDHNLVHHNYFINNQLNDVTGIKSQGWDDGYNNTWYDVYLQEGNWWSNIESYAYRIGGYGYSVDIFPLNPKEPVTPTPKPTTTKTDFLFTIPILFTSSIMVIFRIRKRLKK
ncbi:MAG: right-handed parallel beta-helix repeat-containing protein [Candidatus Heimdallarchaeota archaeon]|nr:right-handed parallel beta-helix repeat-containing protein [Candidatus Heimdallarchaeota archaeon]MCK5142524.1 right-handed parallel beta-helix repeat-containing protein [Candidatus Heimdallarchaeota archaeon]